LTNKYQEFLVKTEKATIEQAQYLGTSPEFHGYMKKTIFNILSRNPEFNFNTTDFESIYTEALT